MALPFVFLSKNLRHKSPKASLHRCLTSWLDYSDNKVVISFSLTEVKWAESLKKTLKEALVLSLCFSIDLRQFAVLRSNRIVYSPFDAVMFKEHVM